MAHLWKGKGVGSIQGLLETLDDEIGAALTNPVDIREVIDACAEMSGRIRSGDTARYVAALREDGVEDAEPTLSSLASALDRDAVCTKLRAELGTEDPFEVTRVNCWDQTFEAWKPMGVLVHITAGNSPIVAPMATVEGLLTSNINIVKCASNMGAFASAFLEDLCRGRGFADHVYLLAISSKDRERIGLILDRADCVSVWGGEDAVESVRSMTPHGTPVVAWGHKISFAYLVPDSVTDEAMDELAFSVCRNDQQSCSSPQCVLVDTEDRKEIDRAAGMLAGALDRARDRYGVAHPDDAQAAEILTVTEVHRCDLFFNDGDVVRDEGNTYRILVSYTTKFMPSPLFRTVWLSPLPRRRIVSGLRGMRSYLQTAGVACGIGDVAELSDLLYAAGVDRVTPLGSMSASYTGEPHDGRFALPQFMRRVSMRIDIPMSGIRSMRELREPRRVPVEGRIQGKADYPPIPDNGTRVLMKSGGTTGEPIYCSYTQRDFENYIVNPAIRSLMAAGLDPRTDVLADLLKSGNLYGGLNSFISITDAMKAPHLSIGGLDDVALAAHYLVVGKATAVLGAPSYIVRMFEQCHDLLKGYGRVRKVFFGGEMMTASQRRYLTEEFGIEVIRGVLYGSNETGTMGYQCPECGDNVYHLCSDIQTMEVVAEDSDEPVPAGEAGRLLFTGFLRENGRTERYDIGDLGRWVPGRCPCGRMEPRFELLGRHGDVIRAGGTFFNYHRVGAILGERFGYHGLLQIVMESDGLLERMTIRVEEPLDGAVEALVQEYDSFAKVVPTGLVRVSVEAVPHDGFEMNTKSVKLRPVVDLRKA